LESNLEILKILNNVFIYYYFKLSFIFEKINLLQNINDLKVLLLEEDYYVQTDAIHTFRKLSEKITSHFETISLSVNIDKPYQLLSNIYYSSPDLYYDATWDSQFHNTGLSLSRAQWQMIKTCSNVINMFRIILNLIS